ncbi:hypothetical protein WJX81_003609 [Elliptochloris bilobata]|uniref:Amino acid transporter transmembrane domain-containing protein n=1 Tax=Elliptochloris bilobata TaxID=381761 RepID=A0AAW1RRK4_9CHLO
MALCCAGTLYSGRLFTLLTLQVPSASVFDDFGGAAMGRLGRRLVYFTVYLTIFTEPIVFHLTSMESLQQVFYQQGLSQRLAAFIVMAIMVPLSQVRGIEDVSFCSVIGIAGMVLALVIAAAKLFLLRVGDYQPTQWLRKPEDLRGMLIGVMDIVFTYGGQVNWMRYIISMRTPSKFPAAVAAVSAVMTTAYVGIGAIGYRQLGASFDLEKPMTSILPQDAWTVVMNAGLFAHCILAYQINLNVWTHLIIHLAAPALNEPERQGSAKGRGAWAVVSLAGIAIACTVAVTFPFFSTVTAVIAALGDLAGAYSLPALFVLAMVGSRLMRVERWFLYALIPLTLALSVAGVYSSVRELIDQVSA